MILFRVMMMMGFVVPAERHIFNSLNCTMERLVTLGVKLIVSPQTHNMLILHLTSLNNYLDTAFLSLSLLDTAFKIKRK